VARAPPEPWADDAVRCAGGTLRERDKPAGHDLADGFALTGYFHPP
jgi:hypothetical protein